MSDVNSGMIIAGKYRVEAALAAGGMGSVWRARHMALDTLLAVKFINANVFAIPEARKRFEREAKAAAMLKSPHVVQIHDYGVEGDLPYLVMELLDGEDLGARLKRKGKLSPQETSEIVTQVARALRRAAEANIVHRDLKPSNVFILRGDEDEPMVKVLDFGIAKAKALSASDDTKTGAIIGSPRYMSPEQARGSRNVDPRSDLWSLAVIAYRALTGVVPFQSNDIADLIVMICSEDPTPPSQIDPALSQDLDAFFTRALARAPDRRFQSARELATAFAQAAGQPSPRSTASFRLLSLPPPAELAAALAPPAQGTPLTRPEPRPAATRPEPAPASHSDPTGTPVSLMDCETTRVSGRSSAEPPPPLARDAVTVPDAPTPRPAALTLEGTLTTTPGSLVTQSPRPPPPRGSLVHITLGTALLVLAGGIVLAAPRHRAEALSAPAGGVPVVSTAAVTVASADAEPPPEGVRLSPPPEPPPAEAPAVEPRAPRPKPAPLRAPPPVGSKTGSKKKHPILGI